MAESQDARTPPAERRADDAASSGSREEGTDAGAVETYDAGRVSELQEDLTVYDPRRHREGTAKLLAILFFSLLAALILVHYIGTVVLSALGKKEGADNLKSIFDVALPVLSSLASSAATYYFTKDRQ